VDARAATSPAQEEAVRRLGRDEALARVEAERAALPEEARGCLMCALAAGAEPIAASEHAVAVLAGLACREGHVLVVLRAHEERLGAVPEAVWLDAQRLAHRVARALESALAPKRVYVAALGSAEPSARSFPHLHLHVVPLPDGDERDRPSAVFTWKDGVLAYEPGEAEALAARIRAALVGEHA
jgi:diadenosine tetraphosphate (Ap4A) HIT family hydrolase